MAVNLGVLEAFLGLDTTGLNAGLASAQKRMAVAGKKMTAAGRTMTRSLSLPLALIGGASVKMAVDFEKSFSKIEGLVGIAADKVEAFKKDVLELAGPTAQAPLKLADAMFFITSAGLRGADALDVLNMSARAAAANVGDVAVIADLVTSATNAYGIEMLSAAAATDTLVATIREGKRPPEEIAQSIGRVLPVAAEMEVSFQEVGAAIAAMSRTGTDAATAVTGLRQILLSILNPSAQSDEAFTDMGTSTQQLQELLAGKGGLIKLLDFLREKTDKSSNAFVDAFPNIRALAAALDVMGKNAEENRGIFARMADNTGDLDKAFNAAAKTVSFQFNKALAELKVEGIKLGQELMPIFKNIIEAVSAGVRWFASLSTGAKQLGLAMGGFLLVLGPVVTLLGTLATIIGGISLPIVAVIAAVAALGAAIIFLADNWDAVVERISDWSWWKNMFTGMLSSLTEFVRDLLGKINMTLTAIGLQPMPNPFIEWTNDLDKSKDSIKKYENQFGSFTDSISNAANKAKEALIGMFNAAGSGEGGTADAVIPEVKKTEDIPSGFFSAMMAVDEEALSNFINSFKMAEEAVDEYIDKGKMAAEVISGLLTNAFNGLGNAVVNSLTEGENVLKSFGTFFATFAKGLLAKMISLIAAAVILSLALAAIGFGVGGAGAITEGISIGKSIGNVLKGGLGVTPQGLASGGFVKQGGLFKVGEKGEELVNLPNGSAVTPNNMARGGQVIKVVGVLEGSGETLRAVIKEAERRNLSIN